MLNRILGCAALAAVMSVAQVGRAEIVTHFGNGAGGASVSNLLNAVGIGSGNSGSETSATTFIVPGVGPTSLTFTLQSDSGAFNFSFGFYPIAAVTANPVSDTLNYAIQAISAGTLVFNDLTQSPFDTSGPHNLTGGTELGFYIIPDNTVANFLANPGAFFPSQTSNSALRSPMFSVTDANPGQFDQMLSFLGNGVTLFTWEDLTRSGGSDQNFVDLAFTINAQLSPGQDVPEPMSVVVWSGLALGCVVIGARRKAKKANA